MKTIRNIRDLEGLSRPYQLQGADLEGASLSGANLTGADLSGADLTGADLRGAWLWSIDFSHADLTGADLTGADLTSADLRGSALVGAKLPELLVKLPPVGESFIGWKKVRDGIVLKLEILANSPRTSTLVGRKCRAKSVKVVEAFNYFGHETRETKFKSKYDPCFYYQLGEVAEVGDYDDDIRVECTRGIHFYMTRKEAASFIG
jgi:hypothetical protein